MIGLVGLRPTTVVVEKPVNRRKKGSGTVESGKVLVFRTGFGREGAGEEREDPGGSRDLARDRLEVLQLSFV